MAKISWLIFAIPGYPLVPIDNLSGHPAVRGCVSDPHSLRSLCSLWLEKSVASVCRRRRPVSEILCSCLRVSAANRKIESSGKTIEAGKGKR